MQDVHIILNTFGIKEVSLMFESPDDEVEAVLFVQNLAAELDALHNAAQRPDITVKSPTLSLGMIERLLTASLQANLIGEQTV